MGLRVSSSVSAQARYLFAEHECKGVLTSIPFVVQTGLGAVLEIILGS